jgi:hypothetical protein
MNGYPRHFIDNAMKTPQSIHQKIEYQSSVCLPYIGLASHKIERILRNEACIKVYHSSENKLFRALCTHKDNINESQKLRLYRIPCECGLVYIGEMYNHRINGTKQPFWRLIVISSHKMRESIEVEKHNTIDQEGKPLDSTWRALFNVQN